MSCMGVLFQNTDRIRLTKVNVVSGLSQQVNLRNGYIGSLLIHRRNPYV